jgi:ATP-binding cassette, subfamily B, bacterial
VGTLSARNRTNGLIATVTNTFQIGCPLALLYMGAGQVLNKSMTAGTMIAAIGIAVGIFPPVRNICSLVTDLRRILIQLESTAEIMSTVPERRGGKQLSLGAGPPEITFDRVCLGFGKRRVLSGISLTIPSGKQVAFVGRSGCGKTTLGNAAIGMLRPVSGRILYNGDDLEELDIRAIRQTFGVVSQSASLFADSIRNNITFGKQNLSHEEIVLAAKQALIHDAIMAMPMKYESVLYDAGASMSGGQRQRLLLARALVRKPCVLLLDEATSALDQLTEQVVSDKIAALNCTRIVIAHRMSTVVKSDLVVILDDGRVVDKGTHRDLLITSPFYAELIAAAPC